MLIKRTLLFISLIGVICVFSACNLKKNSISTNPGISTPSALKESNSPLTGASSEKSTLEEGAPSGVCVITEINGIECYDAAGNLLFALQAPKMGNTDSFGLHFAGSFDVEKEPVPVVYYSWEPEQALIINSLGTESFLRKTNSFLAMTGAAGKAALVFSDVVYEDSSIHSYLFAGIPENLGSADPFHELTDSVTGMALMPVGISAENSQIKKIWYTHKAWNIGGADLVFPINRGLYEYDMETGKHVQVLRSDRNFQGLSADGNLAGSIYFDIKRDHSMRVTDLQTGHSVNFPLNPEDNRGAGFAVFSPDGKYAAWLEAGGSMISEPNNFQTRIRIGEIASGNVVKEEVSTRIAQILKWDQIFFMKPVGWLDSHTVLIEIRMDNKSVSSLIKFNPSLGSLELLCNGNFAGFLYP